LAARRFPPPWSVEEGETYFVVKDHDGQQLAYVHFDDLDRQPSRSRAMRLAGLRSISPSCRSYCGECLANEDKPPDEKHRNQAGPNK
jgi:hypothetical protein